MAARNWYSHTELENKHCNQMQDMMWLKGINWNDYPRFFKRGSFVQKRVTDHKLTAKELENLPLKHNARHNPDITFQRSEYIEIDMPPFTKVINREEVIFNGAEPLVSE